MCPSLRPFLDDEPGFSDNLGVLFLHIAGQRTHAQGGQGIESILPARRVVTKVMEVRGRLRT